MSRRKTPFALWSALVGSKALGRPQAPSGLVIDEPAQRMRMSASLPGLGGSSLFRIALEAHAEPDALGGERLRMRAHIEANFASAVKPALAALSQRTQERLLALHRADAIGHRREQSLSTNVVMQRVDSLADALAPVRARAGHWLARRAGALLPSLERQVAPLLHRDVKTWVELHASTAPLADGANSLLPNAKGLERLGIRPAEGPDTPPLQAWSGSVSGEAAQVTLLRLDENSLPENVKAALGGKPFSLAAAVVSVAMRPEDG
jgi:hypothetical protein